MPISDADFAALSARVQKVENAISGSLSLNSVAVHNNKGQFTGSFNAGDDKNAASLFLANPTGQNQIHIDGAGVVGADDAHGNRTVNIDGNAGRISTQTLEAVSVAVHNTVNIDGNAGRISTQSVAVHNNKGQNTGSFNAGDDKNAASLFLANPTGRA
jgi:hypothetical protein